MTPKEMLNLEVGLLLLKHGRKSILQALAGLEDLSESAVEEELTSVILTRRVAQNKKRSTVKPFNINTIVRLDDGKGDLLRELSARFENRTFLPELKDVKRFFDRHGDSNKALKSRISSQGPLFRLMANLDVTELEKLTSSPITQSEFSSLGLISDEILRHSNSRKNNESS